MRRSKLVIPAVNGLDVPAVSRCGADAVVLDLAHGIPPSRRAESRARAGHLVTRLAGRGCDVFVWISVRQAKADLEACLAPGLAGVVAAVASADEVKKVEKALDALEPSLGLPRGQTQLDLVLASSAAVLKVKDILSVSARAASLNLDYDRLAAEMGVEPSAEIDQFFYPRWRIVFAARLFNIQAHGLAFSAGGASTLDKALLSRKLGLRGSFCWNTADVPALNQGFSYSAEETGHMRKVKEAMDEGIRQGLGAVSLPGGVMIDLAMLKHAQAVLLWSDAIARREAAKGRTRGKT